MALRENPPACVQVDEIESDLHWRSAIAFGRFEEVTKSNEREEILTRLLRKFPLAFASRLLSRDHSLAFVDDFILHRRGRRTPRCIPRSGKDWLIAV